MPRLYRKRKIHGLPPGTLASPDGVRHPSKITLIDYDANHYQEKVLTNVEESFVYKQTDSVSWVNIDGIDVDMIKKIDAHFGVHPPRRIFPAIFLILYASVSVAAKAKFGRWARIIWCIPCRIP